MTDTRLCGWVFSILFVCIAATISAQQQPSVESADDRPGIIAVPLDWNRGITSSPLGLAVENSEADAPYYLRVGAGLPGQTIGSIRYGFQVQDSTTIGLSADHAGEYGNIVNDLGFTNKRNSTLNRIGFFWQSGHDVKLDIGLDYRHDIRTRYGQFNYFDTSVETDAVSSKQNYSVPTIRMRLGHDFTDLSSLNFAVAVDGCYIEDGYHNRESGGNFTVDLAQMIDTRNGLALQASFDGTIGDERLKDYENLTFRLSPAYLAKPIRNLDVLLGFHAILDARNTFTTIMMFVPRIRVSYTREQALQPFAEFDGRLIRNNFLHLTDVNPYVAVDSILPLNTRQTEFRAGIEGRLWGERIEYKLYGGVNSSKHAVMFANSYSPGNTSTFRPLREAHLTEYFGGVKLFAQVIDDLTAEIAAHVYRHKTETYAHASGRPKSDLELLVRYAVTPELFVYGGLTVIGTRYFMEYRELQEYEAADGTTWLIGGTHTFRQAKSAVDLRLGAQRRLNNRARVFIEGHNLLGQKLYDYYHYPHRGASVNLGLTVNLE